MANVVQPQNENWKNSSVSIITPVDEIEELTGLNFLSNIPTEIQDIIEARDDVSMIPRDGTGAPLMATSTGDSPVLVLGSSNQSSIREGGFPEQSTRELKTLIRSCILNSSEINLSQDAPHQNSAVQFSLGKIGISQVSSNQPSCRQIGVIQKGITQISPRQVGMGQISSIKSSSNQIGADKLGMFQVGSRQTTLFQIGSTENDSFEVSPYQGSSFRSRVKLDTSEVTLPGSIAFEQLLRLKEHTSISLIGHSNLGNEFNTINSSVTEIWSNLLN